MAVVFIGNEASALTLSTSAVESTNSATFIAANSRSSIEVGGAAPIESVYAEWPTALAEVWFRFNVRSTFFDEDLSVTLVLLTTNAGNNLFRLEIINVANGTVQPQYWTGSAWADSGESFDIPDGIHEIVGNIVAGGSGEFVLYLDGTTVSAEITPFVGTDVKRITFYGTDDDTPHFFGEIILADGERSLNNSIVETEAPTADATDTDGTGTYAEIDETILSDVDMLTLAAASERNSFTSPARTATAPVVLGVSVAARMKRDASGPQSARFYLKIGGTRYYSDTFALTEGFLPYQYTWAEDPSTTAEWTTSDANSASLEWGIEAVA